MGYTTLAIPKVQTGKCQTVAIGGSSAAATNAVGAQTYFVLLYASSSCHIRISQGANANDPAVNTDTFLPGGTSPILLGCAPGDRIKVIQDTAGGTLYISEMTY